MRFKRIIMCVAAALALLSQMSMAQTPGTCADMTPGQLTSLNGFVPFQGTANLWNTNIANAPVDPNSANIMNFIGLSTTVHPDFGSGLYDGQSMGIPYQVVSASQPDVKILLGAYGSESDPGPAPIPANALVEGYPKPGSGDRHVLVLDKDSCFLYELYNSHLQNSGNWKGDSSAVWDLTMNELRPYTWTSADAAGLPIFPGLARYDEVAAGAIHHALRFTVPVTQEAFVAPASHWASGDTNPSAPPMGTRLRLKASFDISGFSAHNRVILTALKQYGMILADNGSAIYISGAPNSKWSNDDLGNLKTLTGSDFEVVEMGTVYTPANVPSGPAPTISHFGASPTSVSAGQPVTLSWTVGWNVSSQGYNVITQVGAVRGSSVVVNPTITTTYTLESTNEYGRTRRPVTVTVE